MRTKMAKLDVSSLEKAIAQLEEALELKYLLAKIKQRQEKSDGIIKN